MNYLTNKNIFLSFLLSLISIIFQAFGFYHIALWLLLSSYLVFLYIVLKNIGFNSLYFFFIIFYGLYTFSIPISIEFGLDIGKYREKYLESWQTVDYSLHHYVFSSTLVLLGIIISFFIIINYLKFNKSKISESHIIDTSTLFTLSIVSGTLSSLFELVNYIRVGGFDALLKGKAFYQSAISDIPFTLPSDGFFYISVALISFLVGFRNLTSKQFFYFIVALIVNSFYLFVNIYIGERGNIFVAIIIIFLGITYFNKINNIKFKYILISFFLFIFFVFLTINRNFVEQGKNYKISKTFNFIKTNPNKLNFALNPANIEYGAPTLVYRVYIENNDDFKFKYGLTYLYFVPNMLPLYINPYRAPNLVNEIRDNYFPDRALKGSNSSVGYSAMLEALINFGFLGVFIWGTLVSALLLFIEHVRLLRFNKYILLLYLLLFNIILILFRSSSEYIFQQIILYIIYAIVVIFISSFIKYFRLNNY
jgi:oligosaccharide repeat unit polymerase